MATTILFTSKQKIWFIIQIWIHASAAGAAARPAAGADAVCIHYVILGGTLSATLYVHDEIHRAAAEAAAPAAAPAAALAVAPAADPWIHIFIMSHIFYFGVKSMPTN